MTATRLMVVMPDCAWCQGNRPAALEADIPWAPGQFLCQPCADTLGAVVLARLEELARTAPWLTVSEARSYIASQTWVHAQPMFRGRPQEPHQYVLLHRSTAPLAHLRLVAYIREFGQKRRYGGRMHSYWRLDGYEMWSMRPQDSILNRRVLPEPKSAPAQPRLFRGEGLDWPG